MNTQQHCLRAIGLGFASLLLLSLPLVAQERARNQRPQGRGNMVIEEFRILVENLATGEREEPLSPGDLLEMAPGTRLRLRLQAIPRGHRGPRYPSAVFAGEARERHLEFGKIDRGVGSAVVIAREPHARGRRSTVRFEMVSAFNLAADLAATGAIFVRVVDPEAEPHDQVGVVDAEPLPARGLWLFADVDFRGQSERWTTNAPSLRYSRVGNDRVTSIRIDNGCEVTLFEHENYRGRSVTVSTSIDDLSRTPLGNDRLSSFELACGDPRDTVVETRRGAILYDAVGFRGREEEVFEDRLSLAGTDVGNDRIRSVRVERGCRVTLFSEERFRGRRYELYADAPTLEGTPVGLDEVASLRVDCR